MTILYIILAATGGAGGMAAAVRWLPRVRDAIVRPAGRGGPGPVIR
jgi:hypothetical protein